MRRVHRLYESSVGKKVVMAATGLMLFGFVFVHMLGNLKLYTGESHFNEYAHFLRTVGEPAIPAGGLLWIARIFMLACVGVHIVAAVQVWLQSRRARAEGYVKNDDLSFSYASRTMRWGGAIILVFVVYHLMHLTIGVDKVHPDFMGPANPYHNVITGFQVPWVAVFYMLAMIPLGLHIYHGVWSVTQTLSLQGERVKAWRRPFAAIVAAVIVLGNISIPLSVLAGWVG